MISLGIMLTDTTLRDAHQSLIATRMRTDDMLPILEGMDKVGFFSLEVWGGATFDTCIRYLNEDPWERLRKIKSRRGLRHQWKLPLRGQRTQSNFRPNKGKGAVAKKKTATRK